MKHYGEVKLHPKFWQKRVVLDNIKIVGKIQNTRTTILTAVIDRKKEENRRRKGRDREREKRERERERERENDRKRENEIEIYREREREIRR